MESSLWNFFSLWIFVAIARADEQRLLSYLLNSYDVGARPALNASQPLKVSFGMSLHLIVDVDERNQILTTNCWLTQKWHDAHLQWNASDFSGIRVIRIPYQRVWRPDVILYNNADAQYSSSMINTNVIVDHTGEIVWLSHGIFRSSCDINTEHFPFDVQECHMKWASWTYDGFQLDLMAETTIGDTSNYQANGEFDLISFQAERNEKFYSCCPGEPYPDITYVIKLRRRPLFYVFNLILPCILINSIALLVFYVPPESGEKVTLGISSLLSMTVFLMTIRESLPPTEKTPLISLYYGVSICLVSFASGMSVVTLNLHHRGLRGVPVPYMVRKIVLGPLARVVFVHFHSKVASSSCSADALEQRRERKNDDSTSTDNWAQSVHGIGCVKCTGHRLRQKLQDLEPQAGVYLDPHCSEKFFYTQCDGERQPPSPSFFPRRNKPDMGDSSYEASVGRVLARVSSWLDYNESRLEAQDKREALELEWKQVALVCDRSLLALFLVLTVLATCLILFSSPYGPW